MKFYEAEVAFLELQARWQRGELTSLSEFVEQVSQLAVQDDHGVRWAIHPQTAHWMYFDGAEWIKAIPPGRADIKVLPRASAVSTNPPSPRDPLPNASSAELTPVLTEVAPALRARRSLRASQSGGKYAWLPLAIGGFVLVFCSVVAFVGGQSALQAISQQPVFTRTPLFTAPTGTPVPTTVRLPTAPLPTVTAVPVLARVIETTVNVRVAPSLQAGIIGKVQKDNGITLVGRSEDGKWYQVIYRVGAAPAWVFAETLEITSGDPRGLPIVNSPSR